MSKRCTLEKRSYASAFLVKEDMPRGNATLFKSMYA